jgi:hypothetical protein
MRVFFSFLIFHFSFFLAANLWSSTYTLLTWEKLQHVTKYEIEIFADQSISKNEKKLVIKTIVNENKFQWQNPTPGKYFLRIAAIDAWGQKGEYSPLSIVEVNSTNNLYTKPVLLGPVKNKEFEYAYQEDKILFSWKSTNYAKKYRLIVARDQQFKNQVINFETTENQAQVYPYDMNLDADFFWKVEAYYTQNNFSDSDIWPITITKNLYPKQKIKEPENMLSQKRALPKNSTKKKLNWFVGGGGTSLEFTQMPDAINLNETLLSAKGGASIPINQKWDAGFSGFANVFTITQKPTTIDEAKVVGFNLRLGYELTSTNPLITIKLMPGYYLWSMITTGNYGIQNLSGGQLYVMTNFNLANPFWIYGKFAPLAEGISIDLGNREMALGAGMPLFNTKWSATVDYSQLDFVSKKTVIPVTISMTTLSLGLQYQF